MDVKPKCYAMNPIFRSNLNINWERTLEAIDKLPGPAVVRLLYPKKPRNYTYVYTLTKKYGYDNMRIEMSKDAIRVYKNC